MSEIIFKECQQDFEAYLEKLQTAYKMQQNERKDGFLPQKKCEKRKLDSSKDWECEGRLWEGKDCVGCKNCNTKCIVIFGPVGGKNKKRTMCVTCRSDYVKWKKAKKIKAKKTE